MAMQEIVNACKIKGIAHNELAVVIDNAPAHCKAEEIVEANPGVQVMRLGPYSPVLNGIEAWLVTCKKCDQATAICTSVRAVRSAGRNDTGDAQAIARSEY